MWTVSHVKKVNTKYLKAEIAFYDPEMSLYINGFKLMNKNSDWWLKAPQIPYRDPGKGESKYRNNVMFKNTPEGLRMEKTLTDLAKRAYDEHDRVIVGQSRVTGVKLEMVDDDVNSEIKIGKDSWLNEI